MHCYLMSEFARFLFIFFVFHRCLRSLSSSCLRCFSSSLYARWTWGRSALPADHKQNPMLIKQLKDSGKNSQQMVNISLRENKSYFLAWNITMCTICVCIERYVCTCEILLTVERGVASARSVSIVIEMILTAGNHRSPAETSLTHTFLITSLYVCYWA